MYGLFIASPIDQGRIRVSSSSDLQLNTSFQYGYQRDPSN